MYDEILHCVHSELMFVVEVKGNIFSSEQDERPGVLGEVLDEYSDQAAGSKETANTSQVVRYGPIRDFLCFGLVWDASFVSATLSENDDSRDT